MSRLTNKPSTTVIIDGVKYPIKTNFRNCIDTVMALEDDELFDYEKIDILLSNMFFKPYPENVEEASKQVINYLMQYARTHDEQHKKDEKPLYDLEFDAVMIRDAFRLLHVDLDAEDITYPHFMSLMRLISTTDAPYCRVIYLRGQNRRGKLTKEERQEIERTWGWDVIRMNKNKEIVEENDEEVDEFMRKFNG